MARGEEVRWGGAFSPTFTKGKFSLDSLTGSRGSDAYATWEGEPGGTVIERFTEDGVDYVVVEFEKSPGVRYTYFA